MSSTNTEPYPVRTSEPDDANGVAGVVAALLQENIENFPSRVNTALKIARPVAIVSKDTDSACTVVFNEDFAVVYNDIVGNPSVTAIATIPQILNISQLPMRAGGLLPVGFFTKRGLSVIGAILARQLVIKGLLSHPLTVLRLIALISIAE